MAMGKKEKTKVLFLFNATTHYYNLVLNKLDQKTDYEIHLAVPKERVRNVGPGVHQTVENLKISLHELNEENSKVFGCHFPELNSLLWKLKPKIIVCLEPYQFGVFFNVKTRFLLKLLGTKIVLKSIPFRLPNYRKIGSIFKSEFIEERMAGTYGFMRAIRRFFVLATEQLLNRYFYSRAYDGHVCYVEEAYNIYPTYGVKKESIFMTYNSPDTDHLLELNEQVKEMDDILPENPYRLIHVGRLVEWKRVDLLIDAVERLKSKYPSVELLVVGKGPYREEWEERSVAKGVSENVHFLGGIYDLKLLGRYFRSSSIYVLGGMGGLSINDAMCFERPILCSVCDGTEVKLVKDGQNGLYFKDGDLEDLVSKIDTMFSDLESLKKMGIRSKEIIQNDVNINKVLDGYSQCFEYVTK